MYMQAAIVLLSKISSNKVFDISSVYDKCQKFYLSGLVSVCQLNQCLSVNQINIGLSDTD
jgi:hypothetical protein